MKEIRSMNKKYMIVSLLCSCLLLFTVSSILYTTYSYKVLVREEYFTISEATFMVPECKNPGFEYVDEIVPYVKEQLSKYPEELQSTQYQFIFCSWIDLNKGDYVVEGVFFPSNDKNKARIWLLIEPDSLERYREKYFFQTLHHEIFHYIDYHFLEDTWDYDYYGDEEVPMNKRGEYASEYAASSSVEDRAETFSKMMLSEYFYMNQFKSQLPYEKAVNLQEELLEVFPNWVIDFSK